MDPIEREVTLYSYYRDAELRGANLLFLLLRRVKDAESQVYLTQHLSEETRHAWLWTELIGELGAKPIAVDDGYQVRIGQKIGRPRDVVDLFALTAKDLSGPEPVSQEAGDAFRQGRSADRHRHHPIR